VRQERHIKPASEAGEITAENPKRQPEGDYHNDPLRLAQTVNPVHKTEFCHII
jgi:hypothetical protein